MNISNSTTRPLTVLRLKAMTTRTGLSKSTIYDLGDPESPRYDPTFPRRFQITPGTVGWVEQEVMEWLEARIASARIGIPMSA
jgi:prophage regulatory protein